MVEAVFEFYPADAPAWAELSYGRLDTVLPDVLDGEKDDQTLSGLRIDVGEGAASPRAINHPRRRRIWSKNKGELFQFSPELCAYNLPSAYRRFEDHAPRMMELFAAYLKESSSTAIHWAGHVA